MHNNEHHHPARGRAALLAVIVGIALLASGCGGSASSGGGSSSTGASSAYQKELAFSECMRSHGVPDYPDPTSSDGALVINNPGGTTGSGGVSQSTMLAAQQTCRHLLPNGGEPSQAQQQQNVKQELKFVQCMRSHGVPDMPDPSSNGAASAGADSGINPQSPQYQKAMQACQSLLPKAGTAP